MKKFLIGSVAMALALVSTGAMADPVRLGPSADIGLPSGGAVGVTLNPKLDWVRLSLDLTYDYLSFGGRAGVQLDPLALLPKVPVGIFVDIQGGFQPTAGIPGHSDLPKVGFDYVNLYGGLRFGPPNSFHWNFEVGPTYMHITTQNFQKVVGSVASGVTLGNPHANGWIVPTFVTGFTVPIKIGK